jgi:hypothetical protein
MMPAANTSTIGISQLNIDGILRLMEINVDFKINFELLIQESIRSWLHK